MCSICADSAAAIARHYREHLKGDYRTGLLLIEHWKVIMGLKITQ